MSALLDSSVLVAALCPDEERHAASLALLAEGAHAVYAHAFLECFSTLTGGKLGMRVDTDLAVRLLTETILPRVRVIELDMEERVTALRCARALGVRGGSVFDYMHLTAARKAGAQFICTLNVTDVTAIVREGDPIVRRP